MKFCFEMSSSNRHRLDFYSFVPMILLNIFSIMTILGGGAHFCQCCLMAASFFGIGKNVHKFAKIGKN